MHTSVIVMENAHTSVAGVVNGIRSSSADISSGAIQREASVVPSSARPV
jgi:hypothetical protein